VERDDFIGIVSPLVLGMRVDFDKPTWSAYYAALRDVPAVLLENAVSVMLREPREFFPKVGELRAAAERSRRQMLALNPYEACAECEHSRGWRNVLVDGVSKMERCPCRSRHQEKLKGLGLLEAVASLPGEAERESEQVYPSVEQLPADMRQRLGHIAGQKALR
jgi:hypothetical protein